MQAIDELRDLLDTIDAALAAWDAAQMEPALEALNVATKTIGRAWSGSTLGYHSTVYYATLRAPPVGEYFSSEWGRGSGDDNSWREWDYEDIREQIRVLAGKPDLRHAESLHSQNVRAFQDVAATANSIIVLLQPENEDSVIQSCADRIAQLKLRSSTQIARERLPRQFMSRDDVAFSQGLRIPPHWAQEAEIAAMRGPIQALQELRRLMVQLIAHLERKASVRVATGVAEKLPPDRRRAATGDQCDLLLVTVTDVETRAVHAALTAETGPPEMKFGAQKTYFIFGKIGQTSVVLVRSEMGSDTRGGSAITVRDAIAEVRPRAVIMVGIAFGIDETEHPVGTVLVSHQIQAYDLQRIGTDAAYVEPIITSRGDRATAATRLIDRFRSASLTWSGRAVFGLLLSGQKLIDHVDYRNHLLRQHPEAKGGEMEGAGLYASADATEWLIVKAVCDWADGNKREHKSGRQQQAAEQAAAFVVFTIKQGGLAPAP